jgi:polyhydroxyalkanoate synthesis regulator protein
METLQGYIVKGIAFQVEDSATKEDITNATLLQIIVEMEAGPTKFLSTELLRQLIFIAQHPMNHALKTMFEQMVNSMQHQLQSNLTSLDYKKATDTWSDHMQQMMTDWQKLFHR